MIQKIALKVSSSRASLLAVACLALLLVLVGLPASQSWAWQPDAANPPELTVMTRNIYFGTDPTPVLLASCSEFPQAATDAYQAALDTNFPLRAAAIAAEIQESEPDLVGIQEGVIWTELWDGGQTIDFVQMILDELSSLGANYMPLVVAPGADIEFPTTLSGPVRLQVNDVLLGRTDAGWSASNAQSASYASRLIIPHPCAGLISIPRQWAAVDVEVGQQSVRVITTHLEASLEYIRVQQAQELLAGPAATDLPAILMGDFNAETGTEGDAAALIIAAGYADTWPNPDSGPTCCQAADLRNTSSQLDRRIDLVFSRGGLLAGEAALVGDQMVAAPPGSVIWASDHAGVFASLQLLQQRAYLPLSVRASAN